ncbi:hypothetical protein EDB80DRAFT_729579 [Ilyonectria destructans]|nr:hypothetical protein EDB80DRAFT_729579 [Ilyonectria destructans]
MATLSELLIFTIVSLNFTGVHAKYMKAVEQLFLDIPLYNILYNTSTLPLVEPWASTYVDAIRNQNYGTAVWARYHIEGQVENGIMKGENITVLDSIKEDAVGYKVNAPEQYDEALLFYANASSADKHADVINTISNITLEDVADFQALQERATYSTRCSNGWLAHRSSCLDLLKEMPRVAVLVGDTRDVYSWGDCRLRLGPYGRGEDVTYRTARGVGLLIEEECSYLLGCCWVVSGWSPKNNGHRKICLSGKTTGCS